MLIIKNPVDALQSLFYRVLIKLVTYNVMHIQ